jgi:hypothetical protein
MLGRLLRRDAQLPEMGDDILQRHAGGAGLLREGGNPLAIDDVEPSHRRRFRDSGMRHQQILYFLRRDILAATDDDILLSIDDGDAVGLVQHTDVAGPMPAVFGESGGVEVRVKIAFEQIRAD